MIFTTHLKFFYVSLFIATLITALFLSISLGEHNSAFARINTFEPPTMSGSVQSGIKVRLLINDASGANSYKISYRPFNTHTRSWGNWSYVVKQSKTVYIRTQPNTRYVFYAQTLSGRKWGKPLYLTTSASNTNANTSTHTSRLRTTITSGTTTQLRQPQTQQIRRTTQTTNIQRIARVSGISTNTTTNSISVSWHAVHNAFQYQVAYRPTTSRSWQYKTTTATRTQLSAQSGTQYVVFVRAIRGTLRSEWSNKTYAQTSAARRSITSTTQQRSTTQRNTQQTNTNVASRVSQNISIRKVGRVRTLPISTRQTELQWTRVPNAQLYNIGYAIQYSNGTRELWQFHTTASTHFLLPTEPHTSYAVAVRGVNGVIHGEWSDTYYINSGQVHTDGGRQHNNSYSGTAGDCVPRAIAIATGMPYSQVYSRLQNLTNIHNNTSNNNLSRCCEYGTDAKIYHPYLESMGWRYNPGSRLSFGSSQLQQGTVMVLIRFHRSGENHLFTMTNGVAYDTFSPYQRGQQEGYNIYGYYKKV